MSQQAKTTSAATEGKPKTASKRQPASGSPPPPMDPAAGDSKSRLPFALAAGLPLLFFFFLPPLAKSGLWDPYELNVADLGRRLALNLFGASEMSLAGADNSMPHLNDLGRPQLPITSIALGFKWFGLHEWAGRLPLAIWGLVGVVVTYAFVSRLIDRRAGLYSAIALTTMPLFFVQARTMLGDVVTMTALAMSFGGLAVAVFDRDENGPTPIASRAPWLLLAVVGLVSGFESRGGVLGVAVPMLAIGAAWAMTWAAGGRKADFLGDVVGGVALVVGVGVAVLGMMALTPDVLASSKVIPGVMLGEEKPGDLNLWIGAMVKTPSKYPTFDFYVGHLGPALAPWSAFAPLAIGRLFLPPSGRSGSIAQRESSLRMALLVGVAVALVAHGLLAAKTDLIAFSGPALIAGVCGIALRDFERGAHASIALGVSTGVFLGLFHHDFHELPEKAYQAFAVVGTPTFPDSFKDRALLLWTAALIGFALVAFLTWVERDADREPFDPKGYLKVVRALHNAWDGLLSLAFFAMVAGASIAGLVIWVGVRFHMHWVNAIPLQIRDNVLNAWWATAFVPLGIVFGVYFACDVWLWAFGRTKTFGVSSLTRGFEPFEALYERLRADPKDDEGQSERLTAAFVLVPLMVLAIPAIVTLALFLDGSAPLVALSIGIPSGVFFFLFMGFVGELLRGSRAAFMVFAGVLVGFLLCFSYYPALANQLSPKEVFESYMKVRHDGEPLALLGVGGRTSAYYAGGQPPTFNDGPTAFKWLTGGQGQRRFLAMKAEELPKLNQLYREHSDPRTNLPVIDARSSQILLVASKLEPGEKGENPLNKIILSEPPHPQHKLDVNMEDKLECLGYDVTDQSGHLVDWIAPGRKYRMRTYWQVLAPITTEWEAFIHIDGFHRRHNGDHKPLDGKYPLALWLKDDLIVDDYEFGLEPNFSPGPYTLYFGLFVGETRLKVKSGPNDGDNRIDGGTIRVQ